jgi:hypothetical protein
MMIGTKNQKVLERLVDAYLNTNRPLTHESDEPVSVTAYLEKIFTRNYPLSLDYVIWVQELWWSVGHSYQDGFDVTWDFEKERLASDDFEADAILSKAFD